MGDATVLDYYSRTARDGPDGMPLYVADHDKGNQTEVMRRIESAWGCEVHPFGMLSSLDCYALRDGHMVGVMEIKARTCSVSEHDDVFLNVRKWLALMLANVGMGCPALYVVRFTDALKWINVCKVDASRMRIGGCSRIVKSPTDIEPVILVPINRMRDL